MRRGHWKWGYHGSIHSYDIKVNKTFIVEAYTLPLSEKL
jgi:hypothetical protein